MTFALLHFPTNESRRTLSYLWEFRLSGCFDCFMITSLNQRADGCQCRPVLIADVPITLNLHITICQSPSCHVVVRSFTDFSPCFCLSQIIQIFKHILPPDKDNPIKCKKMFSKYIFVWREKNFIQTRLKGNPLWLTRAYIVANRTALMESWVHLNESCPSLPDLQNQEMS